MSDRDQRYTPRELCDRISVVLGGIGLDPTADPGRSVPANYHITEKENCFDVEWDPFLMEIPTAYMNPPYSRTAPFLEKWCSYVQDGWIQKGITLTLAGVLCNKSTQHLIAESAIAICFPKGRINFVGSGKANDRDVVFILWGEGCDRSTIERFSQLGGLTVLVRQEEAIA